MRNELCCSLDQSMFFPINVIGLVLTTSIPIFTLFSYLSIFNKLFYFCSSIINTPFMYYTEPDTIILARLASYPCEGVVLLLATMKGLVRP